MEEENEQLDYDELDDLEIARKKCKELQKAIVIDALQTEEASSTSKNDDNQEVLAPTKNAIQQQKEVSSTFNFYFFNWGCSRLISRNRK